MATASQKKQVMQLIDSMKDELVSTVSELIQIRSVNPGYPGVDYDQELGGETNANNYLKEKYEKLSLEVDMWEEDKGRANLVGVWKGTGGGKSLIHNGHIDTVPPGLEENWKSGSPFSGLVKDNRIWGRGTCDMKGAVVSQMFAVSAIQQAGLKLNGDVILESTVGEENMDSARIGAGATVKRGYKADAAIVSEASAPPHALAVVPTSTGLWWVSVSVEGKASHASMRAETFRAGGMGAEVAVNAIDKGVYLLNSIRKLEDEWGLTKKHPLFKPGHFAIHPGVISGGPHGVAVPFFVSDYCTIEYCIWYHPDEDPENVKKEFESHVHHASQQDEWLRDHPPTLDWKVNWPAFKVDVDHPICKTVSAAHVDAAAGTRFAGAPEVAGFYAVCDAAFLNPQGVPAIVYGPGSLFVAHAADEFVEIDELMVATKTYALATMEWCEVS
jgi:acetylornithine deacetylase